VDAPSREHGARAYIPAGADEKVEWEWPPASRELAVARAREARLQEGGLPVDPATLERVADAVMKPDHPLPGLFLTRGECDDEVPRDVREAVSEHLRRHPEIDGGVRVGWRDGRRTLFVGLAGDAASHQAPLSRIGGDRVAFESAPRTVTELQAIADRMVADMSEIEGAGFGLLVISSDPQHGVVRTELVGHDPAAAARYFAERYGEAVAVEWCGPSRLREEPHPFGSWTSEGRTIRVFFGLDHNGQKPGPIRLSEESDERIVIALSRLQPVGVTTLIGGFQPLHADLELREPVGSRAVIDASTGAARSSLAELGGH
jgi:hypothetical protein